MGAVVRGGSRNAFLLTLEVGDYAYIETTADKYDNVMRTFNTPRARRPPSLAGREFMCTLYRAVGTRVDDFVVLVKIERIA